MRAVILAGGKGTRLMPYTTLVPKPLVPIGNDKTILEIVLEQLRDVGYTRATLAVHHFAHLIEAHFGDGKHLGIDIDYSLEDRPLGTMGPLTLIRDLPENFLVMNGDVLTDLDFGHFLDTHSDEANEFTVSAFAREERSEFGVVETDGTHLTEFYEKPVTKKLVSMGVYALNRRVVQEIEKDVVFGFDDLMLKLLSSGKKVRIVEWSGRWLDIGRPADYEAAKALFSA
jgi:NDP-sugar pyrophosphorylase family protein